MGAPNPKVHADENSNKKDADGHNHSGEGKSRKSYRKKH